MGSVSSEDRCDNVELCVDVSPSCCEFWLHSVLVVVFSTYVFVVVCDGDGFDVSCVLW